MQGVSLFTKHPRKATYYHYYEYPAEHSVQKHFGIRTERYKLIRFYSDGDFWELYDLQKDPNELRNVYNDPAYTSIRKKLHVALVRQVEQLDDSEAKALLASQ